MTAVGFYAADNDLCTVELNWPMSQKVLLKKTVAEEFLFKGIRAGGGWNSGWDATLSGLSL